MYNPRWKRRTMPNTIFRGEYCDEVNEVICLQESVKDGDKFAVKRLASTIKKIVTEKSSVKQQHDLLQGDLMISYAVCNHYKSERDNVNKELAKFRSKDEVKEKDGVSTLCRRPYRPENKMERVDINLTGLKQTKESRNLSTYGSKVGTKNYLFCPKFESQTANVKVDETIIRSQQIKIRQLEDELWKAKIETIKHLDEAECNEKMKTQQQSIQRLKDEIERKNLKLNDLNDKLHKQDINFTNEREHNIVESRGGNNVIVLEGKLRHAQIKLNEAQSELDGVKGQRDSEKRAKAELERKLEEQLSAMLNQKQQSIENIRKVEADLNKMRTERDFEQRTRQDQEEYMKKEKNEFKHFKEKNEEIITSQTLKIHQLEIELTQFDSKVKNEKKIHEIDQKDKYLKELDVQLTEVNNQLQITMSELDEAKAGLDKATNQGNKQKLIIQKLEQDGKEKENIIRNLKQVYNEQIKSHTQNIKHLQDEIEQKNRKLKDLQDTLHKREMKFNQENVHNIDERKRDSHKAAIEDKLRHAQEKLKETETELDRLKVQRDVEQRTKADLERKQDEKLSALKNQQQHNIENLQIVEADLERMRTERDYEQRARQDLENKVRKYDNESKHVKETSDEIITSQNQRIHQLESELQHLDLKLKRLEKMTYDKKIEDKERTDLVQELNKNEVQLAKVNDQLQRTLRKLTETETELNETKTRLSKAMGDRLTDNNPNIADLSDKNRPVKLAERYAELYDNQWTDAFDILGKYFERDQQTIEALLAVQQDVMRFCVESGSKQMKDLQSVLGFSNVPSGDMPADVRKSLKDGRKAASSIALRNLYEAYLSHLKRSTSQTLRRALEVSQYVHESLEICWLMVIQDPPVAFAPVAKPGSELNTDVFKPYTSSGTHVEYTVWPALLLHEGGPVLAKGVAQGYGKKTK